MESSAKVFGIEIDFLPVGEKSKSGDAICIRWGYNLCDTTEKTREQRILVIDGGYSENGDAIVEHIKKYYGTSHISAVINTHPHRDHISGLHKVVEKCSVANLIIHKPWEHTGLKEVFNDGRITSRSIKEHLKEGLESAYSLVQEAVAKKVKVYECFAPSCWDEKDWLGVKVKILGPTKDYYDSLLPAFSSTPTEGADVDLGQRVDFSLPMVPYWKCPLTDDGETSAENNSGIILTLTLPQSEGGGIVLLTGDVGIPALNKAMDLAEKNKMEIPNHIRFFQVPHHGSIQNLGPTVLNRIFGSFCSDAVSYVSVSKEHDDEHPAKHIVNALNDRGVSCCQTQGCKIRKSFGSVPARKGWTDIKAIEPSPSVEQIRFSKNM